MTTVLIAGANRGLGLEFARQYAADGATVIAGVRKPDQATELKAITGGVQVHQLDLTDPASVAAFKQAVGDTPVDIVIANAGVSGPGGQQRLGELDYDGWLNTFAVNTLGPVRLAEAMADNLKRGSDKKLVAITSQLGSTEENTGGFFAYRSSKAALNNAWRGIAAALKDDGVTVVVMHPGWVQTDMGGQGASLKPPESIGGMRRVIAGLRSADTGRFYNYDGSERPW